MPPSEQEWRELLASCDSPDPVSAVDFTQRLRGFSAAVLLTCDDEREYAVKGLRGDHPQMGRALVAEQVIGRIGALLEAPVAEVGLVHVPEELIQAEPQLQHLQPGTAHGSLWITGCSDKEWLREGSGPENRERFARLAMLYGLASAHDHQLIYENQPPHLAHSVDHGHFLPPGAARWTEATLRGHATFEADRRLVEGCGLSAAELRRAAAQLVALMPDRIAEATASVPEAWGISDDERLALADFLYRGARALHAQYARQGEEPTEGD